MEERVGGSWGQREASSEVSWAKASGREGRTGPGREAGGSRPGTPVFPGSPGHGFVVLMFPHLAQRGGAFVCNSANNKCEIFIVFTADPHEIILGWVISQAVGARVVCCS